MEIKRYRKTVGQRGRTLNGCVRICNALEGAMHDDTVLPVLGIRNEDVCTYKYDQGERRCGTGIHGVRSGVEGAMRSYARGFDSLMIRLDLNTIRGILRRKEGEFGPMCDG